MMKARTLIHLWFALLLALGPVSAALAATLAATLGTADEHHHSSVASSVHDSVMEADAAAPPDSGQGHDHGTGHNHATCGVACMAALMSGHSSTAAASIATLYTPLFIPVTGMVFPPHVRPPQAS